MKKILFTAFAALLVSSCSSDKSGADDADMILNNFTDSLSYYMGASHGDYVSAALADLPEELASKIDKKRFMDGFRAALQVDSTHIAQMYGINHGISLWSQNQVMKNAGVQVDYDVMLSGFSAGLEMDSTRVAELDAADDALFGLMGSVNEKILSYQRMQQDKMESDLKTNAEKNERAGMDYVAKQRLADESYKVTDSGLVYKVVREGKGGKPSDGAVVKVNYTGSFIDGNVFDTSDGTPVEFSVNDVIPGFREALMMMNKGAQYKVIIPGKLAYGLQAPPQIGPNTTLVFDIELVDIVSGK